MAGLSFAAKVLLLSLGIAGVLGKIPAYFNGQNYTEDIQNVARALSFAGAAYESPTDVRDWACGEWCVRLPPSMRPFLPVSVVQRQSTVLGKDKVAAFAAQAGDGTLVVSFKGTGDTGEWWDNVKIGTQNLDLYFNTSTNGALSSKFGTVASSWLSRFLDIYNDLKAMLSDEVVTNTQIERVIITGHSLGGVLATYLLYQLMFERDLARLPDGHFLLRSDVTVMLVTFGSPRPGKKDFVADFVEKIDRTAARVVSYRLVNRLDPVPTVPVNALGWRHIPQEVWYTEKIENFDPLIWFAKEDFFCDLPCWVGDGTDATCRERTEPGFWPWSPAPSPKVIAEVNKKCDGTNDGDWFYGGDPQCMCESEIGDYKRCRESNPDYVDQDPLCRTFVASFKAYQHGVAEYLRQFYYVRYVYDDVAATATNWVSRWWATTTGAANDSSCVPVYDYPYEIVNNSEPTSEQEETFEKFMYNMTNWNGTVVTGDPTCNPSTTKGCTQPSAKILPVAMSGNISTECSPAPVVGGWVLVCVPPFLTLVLIPVTYVSSGQQTKSGRWYKSKIVDTMSHTSMGALESYVLASIAMLITVSLQVSESGPIMFGFQLVGGTMWIQGSTRSALQLLSSLNDDRDRDTNIFAFHSVILHLGAGIFLFYGAVIGMEASCDYFGCLWPITVAAVLLFLRGLGGVLQIRIQKLPACRRHVGAWLVLCGSTFITSACIVSYTAPGLMLNIVQDTALVWQHTLWIMGTCFLALGYCVHWIDDVILMRRDNA